MMPMPGDKFHEETVVASCFYSDDAPSFTVMTMADVAPFYRVLLCWDGAVEELSRHWNIADAGKAWDDLTR